MEKFSVRKFLILTRDKAKLPFKNDYLLVLRGLLAFSVVFHHWGSGASLYRLTNCAFFKYFAYEGSYVVYGFFVLSGYLICKILHLKYQVPNGVWYFYYNRLTRILPTYYFGIAFAAVVMGGIVTLRNLIQPLLFFSNYSGHFPSNPPLWSICTEIQFYALAPVIFHFLNQGTKRNNSGFAVIFAGILAFNLVVRIMRQQWCSDPKLMYESLEVNLIFFLTGWTAYLAKDRLPKFNPGFAIFFLLISIFLCWVWDFHFRDVTRFGVYGNPVWYYVLPMVLSFAFLVFIPSLDIGWKPFYVDWALNGLAFLGAISYMAYVFHFPIAYSDLLLNKVLRPAHLDSLFPRLIFFIMSCYILHFLVERPFMMLRFRMQHAGEKQPRESFNR